MVPGCGNRKETKMALLGAIFVVAVFAVMGVIALFCVGLVLRGDGLTLKSLSPWWRKLAGGILLLFLAAVGLFSIGVAMALANALLTK